MKKWISICIFTLCLIFSVNCVWAEGSLSEKQSEAISLMNDLKIYTDITEENASNAITRAEFAKIIVRVMGVEYSLTNAPRRISLMCYLIMTRQQVSNCCMNAE